MATPATLLRSLANDIQEFPIRREEGAPSLSATRNSAGLSRSPISSGFMSKSRRTLLSTSMVRTPLLLSPSLLREPPVRRRRGRPVTFTGFYQ